jgi:hypothetical protein
VSGSSKKTWLFRRQFLRLRAGQLWTKLQVNSLNIT